LPSAAARRQGGEAAVPYGGFAAAADGTQ